MIVTKEYVYAVCNGQGCPLTPMFREHDEADEAMGELYSNSQYVDYAPYYYVKEFELK